MTMIREKKQDLEDPTPSEMEDFEYVRTEGEEPAENEVNESHEQLLNN